MPMRELPLPTANLSRTETRCPVLEHDVRGCEYYSQSRPTLTVGATLARIMDASRLAFPNYSFFFVPALLR